MTAIERAFVWYQDRGNAARTEEVSGGAYVPADAIKLLLVGTDVDAKELEDLVMDMARNCLTAVVEGVDPMRVLPGLMVCGFMVGYRTRLEQEPATGVEGDRSDG